MSDLDEIRKLAEFSESLLKRDTLDFHDPTEKRKLEEGILSVITGFAFWHGGTGLRRRLHGVTHWLFGFVCGFILGVALLWFKSESQNYTEAFLLGVITVVAGIFCWRILRMACIRIFGE